MQQKLRLFCLPFAGGSKYSFTKFAQQAPQMLEVVSLELPGRGGRLAEDLLRDMNQMSVDFYQQIRSGICEHYAIYGHSLGAILGYLSYFHICKASLPKPKALFISGARSPSRLNGDIKKRSGLPKAEFLEELKSLGGSPAEILADESAFLFFEPILRADFEAYENYRYGVLQQADIPIYVMLGTQDEVTYEDAKDWSKMTTGKTEFTYFNGDHFFIFDQHKQILELITSRLANLS